ncbi:peptidoglycan-binding protein [Actinopolymorpha pittospori]
MTRSRSARLGAVVLVVALVGAGGWFAGSRMQSPADAAAAQQPPKARPITVGVVRQPLTASVVAQGSVEFASPRPLTLAGSVGSSASSDGDGELAQRVTKAPVAGRVLKEGDVLMEVSGRPVLVLRGAVPMYRTLRPGTSGDDVRQLQQALRRLGYDPGAVSGTYRQGTASAVTRWYRGKHYQPQEPTVADRQRLGELQGAVYGAQQALLDAEAPEPPADPTGGAETGKPSGEGTTPPAGAALTGESDEARELRIRAARNQLDTANAALTDFRSSYGTKVPAGEVVFFPDLPVRMSKVSVRVGDTPSGQIGTVTSSEVVVQAVVPGADATSLRTGMNARIQLPDGTEANGVVGAIGGSATSADAAGGAKSEDGSSADGAPTGAADADATAGDAAPADAAVPGGPSAPVQLQIAVTDSGQLAQNAGLSAKVTIEVGASDGDVLAVPLVAVRTSANGQARVQVVRAGRAENVPVTVGLSSGDLVEVKPTGGALKEGDQVVVGQ